MKTLEQIKAEKIKEFNEKCLHPGYEYNEYSEYNVEEFLPQLIESVAKQTIEMVKLKDRICPFHKNEDTCEHRSGPSVAVKEQTAKIQAFLSKNKN